jgi:hypothetical protein
MRPGTPPGLSLVVEPAKYFPYQRHGFEIVDTIQVGSSPAIFPMLRQAR